VPSCLLDISLKSMLPSAHRQLLCCGSTFLMAQEARVLWPFGALQESLFLNPIWFPDLGPSGSEGCAEIQGKGDSVCDW
jgi:hypothetical protein